MHFFVVIWWVECVRALAIDSKSLRDKSHSIKNRNTNFLVARIKKTTWTNNVRNILLYFVAISTFITHFTFTSSEFHYSPANYNKKMCYKQNEKHLQHSAANKKKIESFCQKKSEWKHRKEEEAKKKTSMQQKFFLSICTSFCMGMTSMHRREKRSSFCSLIDIFFKIDIILVRIYHRRVLKLAGSPWCGKSRYGETYHPSKLGTWKKKFRRRRFGGVLVGKKEEKKSEQQNRTEKHYQWKWKTAKPAKAITWKSQSNEKKVDFIFFTG